MHSHSYSWAANLCRVTLALGLLGCSGCDVQKFGTDPSPSSDAVMWMAQGSAIGEPAGDNTTIYFGTTDHQLIASDRQGGAVRWRAKTDSLTPRTLNGLNVVLTAGDVIFGDYAIYAFDQVTGARRWTFNPERQGIAGFAPGAYELSTDGSTVYAGSGSGHVYAVNASDGTLAWITPVAVDGHSSAYDPVLDGQTVYVTVRHFTNPITGAVFALDRTSGAVIWSHVFPSEAPTGSGPLDKVIPFGNTIIVANDDGKIYALDRSTGSVQWTAPRLPNVLAYDDTRPIIVAGTTLIAGSTTFDVTGYDAATGRQIWQTNGGQGSSGNPFATDGQTVYVPYTNGVLGAFDAKTGAQRWLRSAPNNGQFTAYPLAADDAVFAPSTTGLIALKK